VKNLQPDNEKTAEIERRRELKRARDKRNYKRKKANDAKEKLINKIVFHTAWV
jgi:hypothetical protein